MKVPPPGGSPPPKPPKGGRPKGLTRRTVKGAAGGMLGVDYEDARRPDPFLQGDDDPSIADDGPDLRRKLQAEGEGEADLRLQYHRADSPKDNRPDRSAFADQGSDQDSGDLIARTKQKKRIKKMRHSHESDQDQENPPNAEPFEYFEDGIDEFDDAIMIALSDQRRSDYVKDREQAHPGDLSLVEPDEIQRALCSPIAYAKHIMILTEAFRRSTGADRMEAIKYMASMFLGLRDARFGWAALKEFGHATGIIDIYPLEVIEYIIENHPGHLPKVGFGRLFVPPKGTIDKFETDTDTPLFFTYPTQLKIRSFALKGGGRPGYLLEPSETPGVYELHIKNPGTFNLLISGLNRSGYSIIDRFSVRVHESNNFVPTENLNGEYPVRDAKRVAQWPVPKLSELEPIANLEAPDKKAAQDPNLMPAANLIHFKTMSAMQGPKARTQDLVEEESSKQSPLINPSKEEPDLESRATTTVKRPTIKIHAPLVVSLKPKPIETASPPVKQTSSPDLVVPCPYSEEPSAPNPSSPPRNQQPLLTTTVLTDDDKHQLYNAVEAVLSIPYEQDKKAQNRPAEVFCEEATQPVSTSQSLSKGEEEEAPTTDMLELPAEMMESQEAVSSPEEVEIHTGEETQPLDKSELERILNDSSPTNAPNEED